MMKMGKMAKKHSPIKIIFRINQTLSFEKKTAFLNTQSIDRSVNQQLVN